MNEIKIVETLSVEQFARERGLEIIYAGRGELTLDSISVSKPGLQLAGFFKYFDSSRIQVLGNPEYEFLKDLDSESRSDSLKKLFSYQDIPCLILSRDLPTLSELIEEAKKVGCPILRSDKMTTTLMNDISLYLNKLLAPSMTVHGVLVDVSGVGILLTGHSGIGKSETALELIKRGHRLVADDNVIIKQISDSVIGSSPEMIRYFMEIRGIGIINVRNMYGTGSILNEKEIELVIEMEQWVEGKEYDRLGENHIYENILGIKTSKLIIPIKPGRNLAIIIEVAARNHRLKELGYDAAQELIGKTMGR
jgi:HPr kinase/phosphorylase